METTGDGMNSFNVAPGVPVYTERPRSLTNETIRDEFSAVHEDGRTYHRYDAGGEIAVHYLGETWLTKRRNGVV
jgi:hypothetical protein